MTANPVDRLPERNPPDKRKCVLFITKDLAGSATRYRALDYFPHLRDHGWEPRHLPAVTSLRDRYGLLQAVRNSDVTVICRKTFTGPYRALLRRAARRLVFDFDDALYLRSSGASSSSRERRFAGMARLCDVVWGGNAHLVKAAADYADNVTLLPTSLNPRRYTPRAVPGPGTDLIWIGSDSTRKYLEAILPSLESAAKRIPKLRLTVLADFDLTSDTLEIVPIEWSAEAEISALPRADIGLAPLWDDDWCRGKCGLKVLQYMAAGLPVVTSPVGVNAELVADGVSGLHASDVEQWERAVCKLSADPELRLAMGRAGRAALEPFDIETVAATMATSLEALFDETPH